MDHFKSSFTLGLKENAWFVTSAECCLHITTSLVNGNRTPKGLSLIPVPSSGATGRTGCTATGPEVRPTPRREITKIFFMEIPCNPGFLIRCSVIVFRKILNILSTSFDFASFLEIISDGFVRYGRKEGKKWKNWSFFTDPDSETWNLLINLLFWV